MTPAPVSNPTFVAGSAIPLPFRLVATYNNLWANIRLTEIPTSYNQIYLFHATPVKDGSGRFVFEYGYVVNSTDIQTVRNRGQGKYGRNFSVSAPPSPRGDWAPLDRTLTRAMVQAGVMDYAGPQFYDHFSLTSPAAIIGYIDEWVAHMDGDASKVVVGFGAIYNLGSSLPEVQQAWATIKQKYPNIRGSFGWSAETDRNAGWTFGNYLGNNK